MTLTVTQTQNLQSQAVDVLKGVTGFAGISVAIDGTTASQLDVTCTASAWAQLGDGTFLFAQAPAAPVPEASLGTEAVALVSINFTGNTTTGSYTLYLDHSTDGLNAPLWTIQLTSAAVPTTSAIAVATFAVAASVITTGTVVLLSQPYTPRLMKGTVVFGNTAVTIGTLPANAVIDYIVVNVTTVFNPGGTNTLSIGYSGATTTYLNAGAQPATASLTVPSAQTVGAPKAQTTAKGIIATYTQSSTAATTGSLELSVFWHQP